MFLSVVLQKLLNGYVKNLFNQVMRVTFIIEDGRIGGAQKYVISIAQLLVKKINVTLIIPKLNSRDLQDLCNAHSINYKLFPITYLTKEKIVALKYILFFIAPSITIGSAPVVWFIANITDRSLGIFL